MQSSSAVLAIALMAQLLIPGTAAAGAHEILAGYEAMARQATPSFGGFSASRGAQFFQSSHGAEWTCATCHGAKPVAPGRHARTGKAIAPLAPAVNPERFADAAFVEKWFRRNCNDVVGRECTPHEKGDVLAWLMSLQ